MTKKVIKNEGFFKIVGQIEQKEIPRFVKSCLLACRVGASTYSEWKEWEKPDFRKTLRLSL